MRKFKIAKLRIVVEHLNIKADYVSNEFYYPKWLKVSKILLDLENANAK